MQPDPRLPADGREPFGSLLRRHRVLAGLSQEALAARAGLSRRGIADLERGARRSPYPDTVRRLASALRLHDAALATFMAGARPALTATAEPYRLPVEPSPLVGRQRELAELTRLSLEGRLLTITGGGGMGKTRLALELAHRTASAYANGAVLVDLAAVSDGRGVPETVALALRIPSRAQESVTTTVAQHLRDQQVLILLDNCEHVIGACSEMVDALLRHTTSLRVTATSREPLRISGERVWIVPPMELDEAATLFIERADAAAGTQHLQPQQVVTIEAMCRRLEGIPLAIELAAVRVPVLGIDQVADHLADRLDFLSRGRRLDPPRHQTLRAALDWSYALLEPDEQELFARLAVFVGGWNLAGAEAVGVDGDGASLPVLDTLTGLVDKSLVLGEDPGNVRRFRLLETVRDYALEVLEASGGGQRTRERHAAFARTLAEQGAMTRLGMRYPGDPAGVRLELGNMRAALRWLLDEERRDEGLALCQALSGFWLGQGLLSEGEEWLSSFLREPDRVADHPRAEGLHAWGRLAEYAGAFDRARELFDRSRETSIEHHDAVVAARALCGLGDLDLHRGDYPAAEERFRSSLAWAETAGSAPEIAQAQLSLGRIAGFRGDLSESRSRLQQALILARRLGDTWGVAYVLQALGDVARRAGDLDQAQTLLEESHVLWRRAGTLMGERAAVMNLVLVSLDRGAISRAADLAGEGIDLSVDLGDTGSATTVRAVELSALALSALGETAIAVTLVAAATTRRDQLDAPRPAIEQPAVDRLLHEAHATLADSGFEPVWADGVAMSMVRAIELAGTTLTTAAVR